MSAISSAVRMLSQAQQILEAALRPDAVVGTFEGTVMRLTPGISNQPVGQACWEKMGAEERHSLQLTAPNPFANDLLSEAPKRSETNMDIEQAVWNVGSSTDMRKFDVDIDLFEEVMATHKNGDLLCWPQSLSSSLKEMREQFNVLRYSFDKFEEDCALSCVSESQMLAHPLNSATRSISESQMLARPLNSTPRKPQLKSNWRAEKAPLSETHHRMAGGTVVPPLPIKNAMAGAALSVPFRETHACNTCCKPNSPLMMT